MNGDERYLDPMAGRGPFRAAAGAPRPNILLISVDMVPVDFHLGGGSIGGAGGAPGTAAAVRTISLDRLRGDGISFARACCTSPLCSPSRAAYLTGRHSYITTNSERAHDGHETHLRRNDVLFPEYLKAVGYHLRHVGKCHAGAARFVEVFGENDAPWDRWSPPWFDDDAYLAFLRSRGLERLRFEREIVGRGLTGSGRGNAYGGWIAPQDGRPFPADATYPAFLVDRAIEALEVRGDAAQPFYLQLDFFGPHQPFAVPGGLEEREGEIRAAARLPRSCLSLAANGFRPTWPEPRVYGMYRRNWGLQDAQTVIDYRVANQLQYELIDAQIGRLLDHLRQRGLYDDTLIVFLADHGEMNGEWGLIDKGAFLNPRVIRVPLVLKPAAGGGPESAGGAVLPGQVVETPVSLLDLAPTLLETAGVSTDARLDGVSLWAAASGAPRPEDRPILFEVWSHVVPNPCVGTLVREADEEYLFAFNAADPVDELYRLDDVRGEGNQVDRPECRAVFELCARRLHERLCGDERWKSYRGFLEITYPELLAAGGDRQLFV